MLNIIVTLFIFILLVTQKVLLLNEESLILLCFITFVFIGITNLSNSINSSLKLQSNLIQENLSQSLNKLFKILNNLINLNKNFELIFKNFNNFKSYYKNLINILSKLILDYTKYNLILTYTKKLIFIKKIEDQTIKLLSLIILKKLTSIIKIKHFYNTSLKINQFKSWNKILLRECIQLINIKN